MGRREKRLAQQKERTAFRNKVLIGAGILFAIAAVFMYLLIFPPGAKKITGIEKHVPANAQSLFISDANVQSWDYMSTLGNATGSQFINAAERVGAASIDGKHYFYVEGDASEMDAEMKSRGLSDLPHKNGVYALSGGPEGLVEEEAGLAESEGYKGKSAASATVSYGYLNAGYFKYTDIAKESGLPVEGWKWYGTFSEDKWVGKLDGLERSDINKAAVSDWVIFTQDNSWINESITVTDDTTVLDFSSDEIKNLINHEIATGINDIKFTVHENGVTELVIERD